MEYFSRKTRGSKPAREGLDVAHLPSLVGGPGFEPLDHRENSSPKATKENTNMGSWSQKETDLLGGKTP